ncbi:MAG: hypothetical protein K0S20_525 [Patescibacteria group bacterium]|nr:hypothetical protein [Patescibacteria group bacterium]
MITMACFIAKLKKLVNGVPERYTRTLAEDVSKMTPASQEALKRLVEKKDCEILTLWVLGQKAL